MYPFHQEAHLWQTTGGWNIVGHSLPGALGFQAQAGFSRWEWQLNRRAKRSHYTGRQTVITRRAMWEQKELSCPGCWWDVPSCQMLLLPLVILWRHGVLYSSPWSTRLGAAVRRMHVVTRSLPFPFCKDQGSKTSGTLCALPCTPSNLNLTETFLNDSDYSHSYKWRNWSPEYIVKTSSYKKSASKCVKA
jgi:hypothetical protein